ncbi:hypothetical protein VPH35_065863 [Triticum aestivum]
MLEDHLEKKERKQEGQGKKMADHRRRSKSLDALIPKIRPGISLFPSSSFSTDGRHHGQADVVVRHPPAPPSSSPSPNSPSSIHTAVTSATATCTTAPPHTSRNPPDRWSAVSDAPRDSPCLRLLLLPLPLLLLFLAPLCCCPSSPLATAPLFSHRSLLLPSSPSPNSKSMLRLLLQPTAARPQPMLLLLSS